MNTELKLNLHVACRYAFAHGSLVENSQGQAWASESPSFPNKLNESAQTYKGII